MWTTILSFLLPVANAGTYSVSVERGSIAATDPAWNTFADEDTLTSSGFRVGYAVSPKLNVTAAWQHGSHGKTLYLSEEDSVAYAADVYGDSVEFYEDITSTFGAALTTDQLSVGAASRLAVKPWLQPFAQASLVGMRGVAQFDDDSSDAENPTQVRADAYTAGVQGGVGIDFPVTLGPNARWALVPSIELGYGWVSPLKFKSIGSVQFAGFTSRVGIGVEF